MKSEARIRGHKIIQQFGDWYIVSSGILHGPMNYLIDKSRLNEPDWVEHIKGKTWSDHNEFMEAYRFARRHWRSPSESVPKRRQRSSPQRES